MKVSVFHFVKKLSNSKKNKVSLLKGIFKNDSLKILEITIFRRKVKINIVSIEDIKPFQNKCSPCSGMEAQFPLPFMICVRACVRVCMCV